MRVIRFTSTAAVVLLFGAMMPALAQHEGGEKQEEKQPQQHAQQPQPRAQQPQQERAQQAPAQAAGQREQQPQQQQRAQQAPPQQQPQRSQPSRQDQPQQRAQQAQQTQPARQQEQRAQQAAPQQQQRFPQTRQQQQQTQPNQQARQQPQPQRTQQQARSWQQQKGWAQGGGSVGHATFAQDRSQNWSSDHRSWAQRGGYGGYYIPQATFSVSFGSQHFFRLGGMPSMYMGYPRFSDGGFSFLIVDPWPGDWSQNWYSSDDVYVDYDDDGYYLYNRSYPQERLAITIVL